MVESLSVAPWVSLAIEYRKHKSLVAMIFCGLNFLGGEIFVG